MIVLKLELTYCDSSRQTPFFYPANLFWENRKSLFKAEPHSDFNQCFHWQDNNGLKLNAGLVYRASGPVLLRNPIALRFPGGRVRTPCPPLWICAYTKGNNITYQLCDADALTVHLRQKTLSISNG